MSVNQDIVEYAGQRLILTDFYNQQTFALQDSLLFNQYFLAGNSNNGLNITTPQNYLANGFAITQISGSSWQIAIENSSIFFTTSGLNLKGLLWIGPNGASPIGVTLPTADCYVYINILRVTGATQPRVFWNQTLNSGAGGDQIRDVDTVQFNQITLPTNATSGQSAAGVAATVTTSISVNPEDILLATITYNGGTSWTVNNYGNFTYWALGQPPSPIGGGQYYDSPATTDLELQSQKDWLDFVMTNIKIMKFGFDANHNWYDPAPSSLSDTGVVLTGGGTISWALSPNPSNALAWSSQFVIFLPSTGQTNTIAPPGGSGYITIGSGQLAYVTLDYTGGAVTTHVVNQSSYPVAPNNYIFAINVAGNIYVGETLQLQPGESGSLTIPLTNQTLAYIGSPSAGTSTPTYSAYNPTHYVADGINLTQGINILDNETYSIATSYVQSVVGSTYINSTGGQNPVISITGEIDVSHGGTGQGSNWNQWGVIYASTTGALSSTAAGTTGQILLANTGGAPTWANSSGLPYLPLAGGTMNAGGGSTINMNASEITNLHNPGFTDGLAANQDYALTQANIAESAAIISSEAYTDSQISSIIPQLAQFWATIGMDNAIGLTETYNSSSITFNSNGGDPYLEITMSLTSSFQYFPVVSGTNGDYLPGSNQFNNRSMALVPAGQTGAGNYFQIQIQETDGTVANTCQISLAVFF